MHFMASIDWRTTSVLLENGTLWRFPALYGASVRQSILLRADEVIE
jgi:hypothetical protein